MKELFSKYQIDMTDFQEKQFQTYFELLIEWNQKLNLTTIVKYEKVIKKHFLDSCLLLSKYSKNLFQGKSIIDVGTGAGFPGIPLAIVLPDTKFVLMDSLKKRIDFLFHVIQKLQLENVELIHGRAEDLGREEKLREQFDFCVSRAVAELPVLMEYCSPFIKVNGGLLFYKSKKTYQEIEHSQNAFQELNCQLREDVLLTDEDEFERHMIYIEKTEPLSNKYPRKAGKAKKRPL